jgi:hypothetical protein
MKKFIINLVSISVCLIFISGITAQSWDEINVNWDAASECTCNGTIDSVFQIILIIDDIANEKYDLLGDDNENWESGATNNSDFPAENIQYYCNELNHENTPNFTIYVNVKMYCENPGQILECKGKATVTGKSCLNFANGSVTIPLIEVKP